MRPSNSFFPRRRDVNSVRLPMVGGIVPKNLFDCRFNFCSFTSFPIHFPMLPVRLFPSNES